jgi:Protein of unknown function (DUF3667)
MRPHKKKTISRKINPKDKGKCCDNCGMQLHTEYRFCPQCGQKNHDFNVSLLHLIGEFIEGFLHLDSKSFQSIRKLVFNPGFLTAEFIKGRRVRYVAPVRLYVFISFIFFLLLSLPDGKQSKPKEVDPADFSISFYGINSLDLRGYTQTQIDTIMNKHGVKPTLINMYVVHQMARISSGGREEFNHVLMKAASYMMFALMPVFAFFVYMLHRKKGRWYINTLVFSIHFHCFAFLILIFCMLVSRVTGISELFLTIPVVFPVYLYLAFRYTYGNSKFITMVKIVIVGVLHVVSMALLILVTTFISLLIF